VSDSARWTEIVAAVSERHGGLDIAHLNAGVTTLPPGPDDVGLLPLFDLATLSDEAYRRIIGVNIDGVVFGARAVLPALEARGGGAIVATASAAGLIAFVPDPIYALTKHAVVGLVRTLAPWLQMRKVTINAICPGVVETNLLGPDTADRARSIGVPVIPPSEIADAVVQAVTSGDTGGLWVCLADQKPQKYEFKEISGLGL
jgi:NAD(P)-dependent dehydrogenase (short-subunit alcohol dehydrogenase family)